MVKDGQILKAIDAYIANGDINSALDTIPALSELDKYQERIYPVYYAAGEEAKAKGEYRKAVDYFALCPDFADVAEQTVECFYQQGIASMDGDDYKKALVYFESAGDFAEAKDLIKACNYALGKNSFEICDYESAAEYFTKAEDYSDSAELIMECRQKLAEISEREEMYGKRIDFTMWPDDKESGLIVTTDIYADKVHIVDTMPDCVQITVFFDSYYNQGEDFAVYCKIDGINNYYTGGFASGQSDHFQARIFIDSLEDMNNPVFIGYDVGIGIYGFRDDALYGITLDLEQLKEIANS